MIICEIGQNHCADIELAKKLIREALKCGGDLVKFQLYDSEKLYGEYQKTELTKAQAFELFNYGKDIGIEVFFSVFDIERVKWCEEMGVKRYKIAYSQRFNEELKGAIPDKLIYVSCDVAHDFHAFLARRINELYCVPKYPTELADLDFNGRSDSWDSTNTFDLIAGFSDHTIGLDAAKIALARGAEIIEKHFAIDHQTGIDAKWSMTPDELRELKRFEMVCKEAL